MPIIDFTSAKHSAVGAQGQEYDAVVVWLHGLGDSADGWMSFAQDIDRKLRSAGAKTKWTLPTAPVQPVSCNGGMKMTSWMDLLDIPISPSTPDNGEHIAASIKLVHGIVKAEVAAGVDPKRIVIGGFSQGAALALSAALTIATPIGGACVFSGWAPPKQALTDVAAAKGSSAAFTTKFLVCHGSDDMTVLTECGVAANGMLEAAGIDTQINIYPGMAHSSCGEEAAHTFEFLSDLFLK